MTVSEVNSKVRGDLERRYPSVWIEGEIVDFKAHSSGHWYFNLSDKKAKLKAVCFRGVNSRLKVRPVDGLQVRVKGKLTIYESAGNFQISVDSLEPAGEGALRLMFERIEANLRAEGLFEDSLKKPIPRLPRRVGVITSPSGAAIHDIARELDRHSSSISLLLIPALVQGEGAGADLTRAVAVANDYNKRVPIGSKLDVLIVGRGGGGAEDLWAFNDENLARAIRASEIPVISAVGHEIDHAISDLAADARAATPTAAAQMVAGGEEKARALLERAPVLMAERVERKVLRMRHRVEIAASSYAIANFPSTVAARRAELVRGVEAMTSAVREMLADSRERFRAARTAMTPARLRADLSSKKGRFAVLVQKTFTAAKNAVGTRRERLGMRLASLDALSPLKVLNRGYAITLDRNGAVVSSVADVADGDALTIRLSDGLLDAEVKGRRGF